MQKKSELNNFFYYYSNDAAYIANVHATAPMWYDKINLC